MEKILSDSEIGEMVCKIINSHINSVYHLNMSVQDFVQAVMLISTSNNCRAQYFVPVSDSYSNTYDILILESNSKILDELHNLGYSLSMCPKGLVVSKFSLKCNH